jgi:cell division protein FtsN
VTEDHDSKIADLYRQSSQETPPAHLDQAVMDRARKSVRRRVYSPFGNNWFARGAMVGVVVLCVMLILDVPQQPDSYVPEQDAVAPSSDALSEMRKEAARTRALSSELPAETERKREAPAAPKAQFQLYEELQDMEVIVPENEPRAVMKQAPAAVAEEPAGLASRVPAGIWYLQAGSFRDKARADALKVKLTGLGFKCEIREDSIDDADVFYHVRVGPFSDPEALDKSRQKLGELGIETRTVKERR